MYTQTIGSIAGVAREAGTLDDLRSASPALHACAAVLVLLATTVLAIFKPRGLTRYGWRRQQQLGRAPRA